MRNEDGWISLFDGKHVITMVNDKVITDFIEDENLQPEPKFAKRRLSSGIIAIQGHDPGSEVHFKNIVIKALP